MNTRRKEPCPYRLTEQDQYEVENLSCGSSCSSCCDYSHDSIPEWNDSVQDNGDIFFIKCSPILPLISKNDEKPKSNANLSKSNKFSTFLKKRKPKKHRKPVDVSVLQKDIVNNASPKNQTTNSFKEHEDLTEHSLAIVFLNLVSFEHGDCHENDVHYYFPQSTGKNVINLIKGALLTLYHLLPKLINEVPESSTIFIKEELVHIIYVGNGKELMLIACPDNKRTLFELKQLSASIKHYLNFKYGSLHECFINSTNHLGLNQFFGNLFIKLLKCTSNPIFGEKFDLEYEEPKKRALFEETFIYPCSLTIPHHVKTRIHEKLHKIESNDFGDLSEDHYGCQRLFTIIGTCLYYKGCLLVSHFQHVDLVDLHSFLCLTDILNLTVNSIIDSLIVWQEVYLSSYVKYPENAEAMIKNRRWFLLVIGKDQGILVAILETGGCSVSIIGPCPPDVLYVEQIQDSLNDILHLILPEIREHSPAKGFASSMDSQVSTPVKLFKERTLNSVSPGTLRLSTESNSSNIVDDDIDSPHPPSFVSTNGFRDYTFSESPCGTLSASAFSDEMQPVLGRRAQRLQQRKNKHNSGVYTLSQLNTSDSDRSDYETNGSSHSSLFIENRMPKHGIPNKSIIHGDEKALFYYVNLHTNRGVILCSGNSFYQDSNGNVGTQRYHSIINNFKLTAQKIHTILSQKKTSNVGKFQRSSLPVKEYGLLFECTNVCNEENKRSVSTSYWVVGRQFNKPQLGEVYVCYEDTTPQNLVEIAFRLAMNS